MENGYLFSIFHFPFAMENTKWATEKATKTTTHSSTDCPLAQLLLKPSAHRINLAQFSEKKNGWWGRHLLPQILGQPAIGAKSLILNLY